MSKKLIYAIVDDAQWSHLQDLFNYRAIPGKSVTFCVSELKPKPWPTNRITLDFDGTVAEFSGCLTKLGKIKKGFGEFYSFCKSLNLRIGIVTARPNDQAEKIMKYMSDEGYPVDFVQTDYSNIYPTNKPPSDMYLNDYGMFFTGDWEESLPVLKEAILSLYE